jgi:hypothetical protein
LAVLDRFNHAEEDTGTAQLAGVLPGRVFVHHFDIIYRADCCTGAPGRTSLISDNSGMSNKKGAIDQTLKKEFP